MNAKQVENQKPHRSSSSAMEWAARSCLLLMILSHGEHGRKLLERMLTQRDYFVPKVIKLAATG